MKRIHTFLAIQSVVAILVSINRLGSFTLDYVLPNEFLRWVDLNNMLILPMISLIAFYFLKKTVEYNSPQRESKTHFAINLTFIIGIYLLAAGYGDHEVTNYLHHRFCLEDSSSDLCRIVIFNDDEFSHWVFFAGFILMNAALLFLQNLFPHKEELSKTDIVLLIFNSLFLGAGIFANLGFEDIGLDLYVVAVLALLSVYFLWKKGKQPLFIYYTSANWLGLIASFVAQMFR
ncbi:MAG: hypothetical protein UZ14_CFX002000952 [Chloroflexi bacterium OLB14]|nr:MAG: hypothetical protein UZ14_CFX002000952 [Chloroflexi bacterium OLB14]